MTHLTHLLRSDVRHFRLLFGAWLIVQVMSAAHRGLEPTMASETRPAVAIALLGPVLILVRWLGTAVMVPLLLQAHPPVGSEAFWLTRPIPWRTLLLSKLILIGSTFVVLPVLCDLVLMVALRVPLRYLVLVSIQTFLIQVLVVALLTTFAAVTRNLAGYALTGGGVLLLLALSLNVGLVVAFREMQEGPRMFEVSPRMESSPYPATALLVCLTAALIALLVVQYRSRSTRAAVSTGVLGIAVAVAVQFAWPWSSSLLAAPDWADREAALRLVVQDRRLEVRSDEAWVPSSRGSEYITGAIRLRLSAVEKTWLGTARLAESSLRFDDGMVLATVSNANSMTVPLEGVDEPADNVVSRDVLGVARLWSSPESRGFNDWISAIVLREPDFQKRRGASATYRGEFVVDLDQLRVAGALGLRPGAELRDEGDRLVIDGVRHQGHSVHMRVRRIRATTMFDTIEGRELLFYLRNPRTSEAIAGFDRPDFAVSSSSLILMFAGAASSSESMGFSADSRLIAFTTQARPNDPAFDLTAEWLAQAELVVVKRVPSGSVVRTIEIPGVQIVAGSPARPAF